VNIPRSIQGVEVALLFREVTPEEYRVSIRSRGKVNVGRLALQFDGGGHHNAAGCTLHGKEKEVYGAMIRAVGEALR
jgi:phosphoesterase RecJ-like protein